MWAEPAADTGFRVRSGRLYDICTTDVYGECWFFTKTFSNITPDHVSYYPVVWILLPIGASCLVYLLKDISMNYKIGITIGLTTGALYIIRMNSKIFDTDGPE